ncbi:hypothetical protein AVHM3334_01365 [Acidovorax sp. SUPP3334]|nr:hypothetical protein AVHM3334_01365 [Acidovorax sp. SUPP3334]
MASSSAASSSSAPRRALVVIDVQNEYFAGGNLPIEYPPVADTLPNIVRAMDAARAAGLPVVVVQHTAPAGAPLFDKATDRWQLHPEVAPTSEWVAAVQAGRALPKDNVFSSNQRGRQAA